MKKNFIDNLISLLPTPILERLDIDLNKQDIRHSRGDLLYAIGTHSNIFPGFRVTSHVADGLMTFGLLYFPIQFIIFLCIFKLQNALVFYTRKNTYILFSDLFVFSHSSAYSVMQMDAREIQCIFCEAFGNHLFYLDHSLIL